MMILRAIFGTILDRENTSGKGYGFKCYSELNMVQSKF